ncbi:MAG: hypothetical protein KF866_07455 [Phycisphaeraceae bacterium]|nr:hypothetical protein [Phycisphaeraceae bacterium]MCW5753716.1 hypothetical protein [Phycisphaeraceae bacterium]
MKIFWSLVAVLVLAAAGMLYTRSSGSTGKMVAVAGPETASTPNRATQSIGGRTPDARNAGSFPGTAETYQNPSLSASEIPTESKKQGVLLGSADESQEPTAPSLPIENAASPITEAHTATTEGHTDIAGADSAPPPEEALPTDAGEAQPGGSLATDAAGVSCSAPVADVSGSEAAEANAPETVVPGSESPGEPPEPVPGTDSAEAVQPTPPAQPSTVDPAAEAPPAAHEPAATAPDAAEPVVVEPSEPAAAEPSTEAAPGAEAAPATEAAAKPVATREDGSLLIDGRWVVRGEGTSAKPYELPWELLVSVRDVYNPRQNKNTLPEWTSTFHEKHVRITGYLLLPLAGDEFDELLIMRNQWDGCCIGVPPTAYDAVEVKLAQTVSLSRLSANYGNMTGVFRVDPYLSGRWLIGLYVMDGGVLTDAQGRNLTPQ